MIREICLRRTRHQILDTYLKFEESDICKIFDNQYFGYTKVTIEQPLKENGIIKVDRKGNRKPDSKLRDSERIPLSDNIEEYYEREVLPHLSESWMDRKKIKLAMKSTSLSTSIGINLFVLRRK